jgi:hypothetical protein
MATVSHNYCFFSSIGAWAEVALRDQVKVSCRDPLFCFALCLLSCVFFWTVRWPRLMYNITKSIVWHTFFFAHLHVSLMSSILVLPSVVCVFCFTSNCTCWNHGRRWQIWGQYKSIRNLFAMLLFGNECATVANFSLNLKFENKYALIWNYSSKQKAAEYVNTIRCRICFWQLKICDEICVMQVLI